MRLGKQEIASTSAPSRHRRVTRRLASRQWDLEHEPEVRLRVQAVHAPECLRADTAGDHLRPKVDPAAGEVHDEGGLSQFFHDRISNVGPVNQAGSKPFDNPLGAPANGSVLRRYAPPDRRHPHPPKVPFRGSKRGVRVGVRVLLRGVRVSCRGRNPHRTATGFGAYPGARLSVGEGGEPGTDFTPPFSLPWRRAANPAPKVPPIFATVGRGPDCTGGAFGPRKGGYPLSHVSYSRRRTGTSPRLQAPLTFSLAAGSDRAPLGPLRPWRSVSRAGPGAPSERFPASLRYPVGPPVGDSSDIRRVFLGSKIAFRASETIRGHPRPLPVREIPSMVQGPWPKLRWGARSTKGRASPNVRGLHDKDRARVEDPRASRHIS